MKDRAARRLGCLGVIAAYALAIGLAALLVCGCTAVRQVPVETVRTEWRDRTALQVDTVLQSDTQLVYVNGDTVVVWRDRWRERVKETRDTIFVMQTDSVTTEVEVERRLTAWESVKMDYGGWAIIAAIGLVYLMLKRRI